MSFVRAFSKSFRNVFGWLIRILKPPRKSVPDEWSRRLLKMQKCETLHDLVGEFGQPAHKIHTGDIEIWHFPLGFHDGFLYSIHATVTTGQDLSQIYMHVEPADHP